MGKAWIARGLPDEPAPFYLTVRHDDPPSISSYPMDVPELCDLVMSVNNAVRAARGAPTRSTVCSLAEAST